MFEKTDTTSVSVIVVITLWEYITHTKFHTVLPFCGVSICESEVQMHAKHFSLKFAF